MIVKLYLYFGVTGILSVLAWITGVVMLVNYCRHPERTRHYIRALCVALLAVVLSYFNMLNVNNIKLDLSEEQRAQQEANMRRRAAELKRLGDRAADIKFAEDGEYDHLDLAGVKDVSQLNKYERAARGLPAVPSYKQEGKQRRIVEEESGEVTDAGFMQADEEETSESIQDDGFRYLPRADLENAVKYARMNRTAVRVTLLLALLCVMLDYFSFFNKTFKYKLPLPFACRVLDHLFPKHHLTVVPAEKRDVLKQYMLDVVKKGETFIYIGNENPIEASFLPRIFLPFRQLWQDFLDLFRPNQRKTRKTGNVKKISDKLKQKISVVAGMLSVWLVSILKFIFAKLVIFKRLLKRPAGKLAGFLLKTRAKNVFLAVASKGRAAGAAVKAGFLTTRKRFTDKIRLRVENGTVSLMPFQKVLLPEQSEVFSHDFVFESAWFNRYCFVFAEKQEGLKFFERLHSFLDTRFRPRASARQTVNIILDFDELPAKEYLKDIAVLAKDSNLHFILAVPEQKIGGLPDIADEIYGDDTPSVNPSLMSSIARSFVELMRKISDIVKQYKASRKKKSKEPEEEKPAVSNEPESEPVKGPEPRQEDQVAKPKVMPKVMPKVAVKPVKEEKADAEPAEQPVPEPALKEEPEAEKQAEPPVEEPAEPASQPEKETPEPDVKKPAAKVAVKVPMPKKAEPVSEAGEKPEENLSPKAPVKMPMPKKAEASSAQSDLPKEEDLSEKPAPKDAGEKEDVSAEAVKEETPVSAPEPEPVAEKESKPEEEKPESEPVKGPEPRQEDQVAKPRAMPKVMPKVAVKPVQEEKADAEPAEQPVPEPAPKEEPEAEKQAEPPVEEPAEPASQPEKETPEPDVKKPAAKVAVKVPMPKKAEASSAQSDLPKEEDLSEKPAPKDAGEKEDVSAEAVKEETPVSAPEPEPVAEKESKPEEEKPESEPVKGPEPRQEDQVAKPRAMPKVMPKVAVKPVKEEKADAEPAEPPVSEPAPKEEPEAEKQAEPPVEEPAEPAPQPEKETPEPDLKKPAAKFAVKVPMPKKAEPVSEDTEEKKADTSGLPPVKMPMPKNVVVKARPKPVVEPEEQLESPSQAPPPVLPEKPSKAKPIIEDDEPEELEDQSVPQQQAVVEREEAEEVPVPAKKPAPVKMRMPKPAPKSQTNLRKPITIIEDDDEDDFGIETEPPPSPPAESQNLPDEIVEIDYEREIFKFFCPVCGQKLSAAFGTEGYSFQCPSCKNQVVIPNRLTGK